MTLSSVYNFIHAFKARQTRDVNMGHSGSKRPEINKKHEKQKMFKIGLSVGRNDLNLEGHFQLGYHGKTIKNYKPIENDLPPEDGQEPVPTIEEE